MKSKAPSRGNPFFIIFSLHLTCNNHLTLFSSVKILLLALHNSFLLMMEDAPWNQGEGTPEDVGNLRRQTQTTDRAPESNISDRDQGEGIPGEYIRSSSGEKVTGAGNIMREKLKLGDRCDCGNGVLVIRRRYQNRQEYIFLACSDFRAGVGCNFTQSLGGERVPKYFTRSPVANKGMITIF